MKIELKQLSPLNGMAEYEMLQDLGSNENGFPNEVYGISYGEYRNWLIQQDDYSKSRNLPENYIPQSTYFLYVEEKPVGIARIRHHSSEILEKQGVGNFGYGIAKQYRGKGYGNILFVNILEKCKSLGYTKVKSFVHMDNAASNKIFEKNGAVLTGVWNNTSNIHETDPDVTLKKGKRWKNTVRKNDG